MACAACVIIDYKYCLFMLHVLLALHVLQVYIQPWDTSAVMPAAAAAPGARHGSSTSGEHCTQFAAGTEAAAELLC